MHMRFSFVVLTALGIVTLAGCNVRQVSVDTDEGEAPSVIAPPPAAPGSAPSAELATPAPAAMPKDAPFNEVVYVLMKDRLARRWFCTGTLVSKTTVVTAGHCLDTMFVSYEVVAPHAAGSPRVAASKPMAAPGDHEDPAVADFGFLTLSKAIDLPAYAQLTDVTARVLGGEELSAAASVRTREEPEAPLRATQAMAVTSTHEFGYQHGFGTPLFSNGGDSGAGLFLVENGVPTHKLIGVARQPDPARNLDQFTRIDADVLAWYAQNRAAR